MSKFTRLVCLFTVVFTLTATDSRAQLFVENASNGTIGEYNTDGTTITNALITQIVRPEGRDHGRSNATNQPYKTQIK